MFLKWRRPTTVRSSKKYHIRLAWLIERVVQDFDKSCLSSVKFSVCRLIFRHGANAGVAYSGICMPTFGNGIDGLEAPRGPSNYTYEQTGVLGCNNNKWLK